MRKFNGSDYLPGRDNARLTTQLGRVFHQLKSGAWITLDSLSKATGDPAASVSAQMRHLRKPAFGSHTIDVEYIGSGLYAYRLNLPNPN